MGKRQKVLIIDESKLNRDLLKEKLGETYNYLGTENGNSARSSTGIYCMENLQMAPWKMGRKGLSGWIERFTELSPSFSKLISKETDDNQCYNEDEDS